MPNPSDHSACWKNSLKESRWPDILLLAGIFLVAFAIRLIYLSQIKTFPLFYYLVGDSRIYDQWARQIAEGGWMGTDVFYQAPLYPYLLGLFYWLLRRDLWWVRLVQMVLGAISCVLLYWIGKSFFSRATGIIAGLMLASYAPAIFFDGLIQKATIDSFLVTLLLVPAVSSHSRPHWAKFALIGILLGFLVLTRENAIIWLAVIPVWIYFYFDGRERRLRLAWVGAFLVGLFVILLPVGLRNLKIGGDFVLTTAQMGPNFFIGNNPLADGTYIPLKAGHGDPVYERKDATEVAERALGRSLSPHEISAYWMRRSWDYIRSQPVDWLLLLGRKWLILWNVRELEDADDFYLYKNWSVFLSVLGQINHFGVLAPLAITGLFLAGKEWRRLALLHALLITFALSITLFYVFGRYRMAMMPFLALFAADCVVRLKRRAVRQLLGPAVIFSLAAVMVYWPVIGNPTPSAAGLNNLGNALVKQGRIEKAEESYRLALRVEPRSIVVHYNLASLFARQGKIEEAVSHLRQAVAINPDYAEAHYKLGMLLGMRGDMEGAASHFRQAIRIQPDFEEARRGLARALQDQKTGK